MTTLRRFTEVKPLDPAGVKALADDHPAVVEGRALFPTRRAAALEQDRVLVSGKNSRKIGAKVMKGAWKGMPIFTLTLEERATCPRTCEQWASCYGNGMQWSRRHEAGIDLENILWLEVRDLIKKHGRIAVRLHVLGDFYSAQYVRVWRNLMAKHEGLHVFGFTARNPVTPIGSEVAWLNRDYPERFVIRWSDWPEEMGAVVLDHIPDGPKEGAAFVCPAQTGKTACCATCGLCWSPAMVSQPVAFVLHGNTKKRANAACDAPVADKKKKQGEDMAWPDERVELLKKLWADGLSASQIAKTMGGVTRNSVIGKVHRLGPALCPPRKSTQRTVRAPKPKPKLVVPEPKREPLEEVTDSDGVPITVLTLKSHMCRWPIGDVRDAGFHFCGQQKDEGSSYCEAHHKMASAAANPGSGRKWTDEQKAAHRAAYNRRVYEKRHRAAGVMA